MREMKMKQTCPCGLSEEYKTCCEPYLNGDAKPETAEQLMRSRYVAYTQANIDYIKSTHSTKTIKDLNENVAIDWAKKSDWIGLEIINTEKGQADDEQGFVEFKAHYRDKHKHGQRDVHHEISEFIRQEGDWVYLDGRTPEVTQVKRDHPKVGRNDPCYCGSGKKRKKCCP